MARTAGISVSSVQRIWKAHGLQPHRVRTFKLSNDPRFADKLRDVVGLYVAFAIPIWLRWKAGSRFRPGGWNLGGKYRWMCVVAVAEIAITSVIALMPTSVGGAPWYPDFAWKYVNYAILVVPGTLILLWIYWHVSVKNWFTGPKNTVELPMDVSGADQVGREHHHGHEAGTQ